MKLQHSAPQLARLRNKGWHVDRMLPDIHEIMKRAAGVPQIGNIQGQIALDALDMWQDGSQQSLAGVVQSIGIPAANVFKTIVDTFKIDPAQDVARKLEEVYKTTESAVSAMGRSASNDGGEAMRIAAESGVSMGVGMVTAIPVAGLVVRIAWSVAKLGVKIAALAKKAKSYGQISRRYPPSMFYPERDQHVLNSLVLDQVRTGSDWTGLFCPPALGRGPGSAGAYAVKRLEGGGIEIFRRSGFDEDGLPIDWSALGWLGFVPGSALLHSGIRVKGRLVSEIGSSLFPSARGIAAWQWKQVTSPDAMSALMTVHADAVSNRWKSYISQLHEWIDKTGELNIDQKAAVMRTYNGDWSGRIFGWGDSIKPWAHEQDSYEPVRVAEQLRARQLKACDTLLIAYVDEDFGAFRDAQVRSRFRQRRKDLLEHPAVCDVSLASVVDPEYKEALRSAGAGSIQCAQGPKRFAATPPSGGFGLLGDDGEGGQGGFGGLGGAPPKRSSPPIALFGLGIAAAYGLHRAFKK